TEKYGIIPRSFIINELQNILKKYKNRGKIVDFYISELTEALKNTLMQIDLEKEEDILKILSFLETNEKFLYLREASMLIFGDSKYFENKRKFQVNGVLSQYLSFIDEERFDDENLLKRFNIYDTEQEICLKGPMTIEMYGKEIDVECFSGGVSFSIQDIEKVSFISVRCEEVMTIENKTSFLRMNHPYCYMYLGGFATKAQIAFIKKLFKDNPDKIYSHFGDIDAGGFWIHKKLCEQTGINFQLFHMNENDLRNPTYSNCLQPLTEQDQKRLCTLKEDLIYGECIHYMLDHNVKLEQEIISLNISNL
ncbi:Wadjet anti-phage system protein JetD domain-containing protein, partial [uncultured Dubosiella sp.]|uniref:Wadjet anti-phage system protein JetD domain-containing protein n=1 Tax=uncultured Dubosiella sp. TaxID=1937011 RepID=UPI00272DA102